MAINFNSAHPLLAYLDEMSTRVHARFAGTLRRGSSGLPTQPSADLECAIERCPLPVDLFFGPVRS